jgi:hypothetical protein
MNASVANARNLIIAGIVTFIAVVWWATRAGKDAPAIVANPPGADPQATATPDPRSDTDAPAAAGGATPATPLEADAAASQAGFRGYVDGKYRYLFRGHTMKPEAEAALRQALLERERIATEIRTAKQSYDENLRASMPQLQAELATAERKVGALLPASEITAFDVLKDSDIEQFQLEDYAGGISNVAPISEDDKQSILYTKLLYRQRFRRVLDETRLMQGELTREERKAAFAEVSRALKSARDSYLQEVRQYLFNDEQYQLLSNYENTEYTAELEKLRGIADGD